MDEFINYKDGLITCKGKSCGRKFGFILKHFSRSPECKNAYSQTEYETLQNKLKRISNEKKLSHQRSIYDREKRAKKYQLQEKAKYDKQKRAKKYQLQEKAKYDKEKRAEKYQLQEKPKYGQISRKRKKGMPV